MIHQRNVLAVFYIVAAIIAFMLSTVIGSIFVALIIVAIGSLPIIFLIKKMLPPPDWYANEDGKSNVTTLNLSSAEKIKDVTK